MSGQLTADEQETVSVGCMLMVFAYVVTFLAGCAVGFWVLK